MDTADESALRALLPGIEAVLDHPLVRRLGRVRQTGPVAALHAGAAHTRLQHSVGCAVLAWHAAEALREHQPRLGVTATERAALTVAALLHDVGHGPFSHSFDRLLAVRGEARLGPLAAESHEGRGARLWLRHIAPSVPPSLYEGRREDFEAVVAAIISGQRDLWPDPTRAFLGTVVAAADAGGLDVDRIDYLWRDARALRSMNPPLLEAARHDPVTLSALGRVDAEGCWRIPEGATVSTWLAQRRWYHDVVVAHEDVRRAEEALMAHWEASLSDEAVRAALCEAHAWARLVDSAVAPDAFLPLGAAPREG